MMLEGEVVAGFGRGSSQIGVPTANIAPGPLAHKLEGLPLGVYFGCVAATVRSLCWPGEEKLRSDVRTMTDTDAPEQ
jgi:FAD synthase